MKLTKRDLELLRWVNSLGFVSVEHVEEKYGIARKTAYRLLGRLVSAQLMLYEQPIHNQLGLYRVSAYGVEVSGDRLPALRKISMATLKHDCCVASVSLALTKDPSNIFFPERWLRQELGIRFSKSKDHVSDGHLITAQKKIAIEVELTVKSEHRLKQIFMHHRLNSQVDEIWYFYGCSQVRRKLESMMDIGDRIRLMDLRSTIPTSRWIE